MAATIASRSARGTNSRTRRTSPISCRAPALTAPRLADLAALDDAAFRALFAGSPVKRIGRDRFLRNVLIAIGNAEPGDELLAAARRCLDDRGSPGPRRRGLGASPGWPRRRPMPPSAPAGSAAKNRSLVREEWQRRPAGL